MAVSAAASAAESLYAAAAASADVSSAAAAAFAMVGQPPGPAMASVATTTDGPMVYHQPLAWGRLRLVAAGGCRSPAQCGAGAALLVAALVVAVVVLGPLGALFGTTGTGTDLPSHVAPQTSHMFCVLRLACATLPLIRDAGMRHGVWAAPAMKKDKNKRLKKKQKQA
jgi:hypothetical protein